MRPSSRVSASGADECLLFAAPPVVVQRDKASIEVGEGELLPSFVCIWRIWHICSLAVSNSARFGRSGSAGSGSSLPITPSPLALPRSLRPPLHLVLLLVSGDAPVLLIYLRPAIVSAHEGSRPEPFTLGHC